MVGMEKVKQSYSLFARTQKLCWSLLLSCSIFDLCLRATPQMQRLEPSLTPSLSSIFERCTRKKPVVPENDEPAQPLRCRFSSSMSSGSGFHPYLGAVISQILSTSRFIALCRGLKRLLSLSSALAASCLMTLY